MTKRNLDSKPARRLKKYRSRHPRPPTNMGGHILGNTRIDREKMLAEISKAAAGKDHHPLLSRPYLVHPVHTPKA